MKPRLCGLILFFFCETILARFTLHCGHLIDTQQKKVFEKMSIVVIKNTIHRDGRFYRKSSSH